MAELKSRDELITENLRLVHSLCKRFSGRGIEYDDLFQTGCIGLIKAADGFDNSRGLMFSTYAVPVILGEIKRLFRDGGAIKVSRHLKELSFKIRRADAELELRYNREPTVLELAEHLGVSTEEITEAVCANRATVSLTRQTDDDEITQLDIKQEGIDETLNDKITVDMASKCLEKNERLLIIYRYYKGLTQSETAKRLGMSQVQVSRAEKKILLKMRKRIDN